MPKFPVFTFSGIHCQKSSLCTLQGYFIELFSNFKEIFDEPASVTDRTLLFDFNLVGDQHHSQNLDCGNFAQRFSKSVRNLDLVAGA